MLRSDEQVALDQVHRDLLRTAQACADAATLAGTGPLGTLLARLSERHRELAEDLVPHIAALGDRPGAPDADRQTLRLAARHLRAAVARDERLVLIRGRERDADHLAESVSTALATSLPEPTRQLLRTIRAAVDDTRERLYQARVVLTEQGPPHHPQ